MVRMDPMVRQSLSLPQRGYPFSRHRLLPRVCRATDVLLEVCFVMLNYYGQAGGNPWSEDLASSLNEIKKPQQPKGTAKRLYKQADPVVYGDQTTAW